MQTAARLLVGAGCVKIAVAKINLLVVLVVRACRCYRSGGPYSFTIHWYSITYAYACQHFNTIETLTNTCRIYYNTICDVEVHIGQDYRKS